MPICRSNTYFYDHKLEWSRLALSIAYFAIVGELHDLIHLIISNFILSVTHPVFYVAYKRWAMTWIRAMQTR